MKYNYSEIVPYLLDWYDSNARILRWRSEPKPYYVWISEIMLQQTRVEAVKEYFDRFVDTLPDVKALAEVEEGKLLKLWEGLGYYNRVRNLKKTAITIMEHYKGELPASYEELLKLSGIGTYTAGAISSIAFGIPVPAVDGNVLRVAKRIAGSFDDITKAKVKRELEADLTEIMPKDRPGDFNQSLMELGAVVCIPNGKPLCEKCPIMHLCKSFKQDLVMQIPVKPAKKERKLEEKTILLMEYQGRYALQPREDTGLLAGLWELPSLEGKWSLSKVEEYLNDIGLKDFNISKLEESKHIFSHVEWHMIGYKIAFSNVGKSDINDSEGKIEPNNTEADRLLKENNLLNEQRVWGSKEQVKEVYALPTAFKAYTKIIKQAE